MKKIKKNNRWGLEKLIFYLNCSHFPISDNSTLRYSVHRNSCFLKRVLENGLSTAYYPIFIYKKITEYFSNDAL